MKKILITMLLLSVFVVVSCDGSEGFSSFSELVGEYAGEFSGIDSGTWTTVIDKDGKVSGVGYSESLEDTFSINGTINLSGKMSMTTSAGVSTTGGIFVGHVSKDYEIEGKWGLSSDDLTNDFWGKRIEIANTTLLQEH